MTPVSPPMCACHCRTCAEVILSSGTCPRNGRIHAFRLPVRVDGPRRQGTPADRALLQPGRAVVDEQNTAAARVDPLPAGHVRLDGREVARGLDLGGERLRGGQQLTSRTREPSLPASARQPPYGSELAPAHRARPFTTSSSRGRHEACRPAPPGSRPGSAGTRRCAPTPPSRSAAAGRASSDRCRGPPPPRTPSAGACPCWPRWAQRTSTCGRADRFPLPLGRCGQVGVGDKQSTTFPDRRGSDAARWTPG